MSNIYVLIPVADPAAQNFDNLVGELTGNYVAEDIVRTVRDEEGNEVEEVITNPYATATPPDFSGKILLVSNHSISAPEGAQTIVVDGELNVARLWNTGSSYAFSEGATHVVILNEVSSINPHVFALAVAEHDEPVINLSDGGCFIITPGVVANEAYRWWFSDVEIFENNQTDTYRDEFLNIIQENRIDISGAMKDIVDADMITRSQS